MFFTSNFGVLYNKSVVLDEDPEVPTKLRYALLRKLRCAKTITVKVENAQKRFNAINGLKLNPREAETPDESPDEIALGVVRIMHRCWLDKNETSEDGIGPLNFRIEISAPNGPTKRPSLPWTWNGEEDEDDFDTDLYSEERAVLQDLLTTFRQSGEAQHLHISDMQERFLKLAELNADPIRQVGEQLNYANQLNIQGMAALVQAAQMTYSFDATKAMEEEKTARSKILWDKLGGYVGPAMGQFMAFLGAKATGAPPPTREYDMPGGRGSAHPRPPGPPEPAPLDDDIDPHHGEEDLTDLIAKIAEAFGAGIVPKQRRALRPILGDNGLELFDDMFCCDTDAQAIAAYDELRKALEPAQLLQLGLALTPGQMNEFQAFQGMVAKAKQKQAQEDGGGETEPDDED